MEELKTLKDIQKYIAVVNIETSEADLAEEERDDSGKLDRVVYPEDLKQEAIKDLINIYELEKILKIKLNDKTIGILNKYIMWKFNITEEDLK